jgi:antitoxin component YwqK of YwqJK toxin-antitoxin module
MKRLLLIVLPLLLIVGCSKPISEETLIDKDGLKYHSDTKELFSGKVYSNHMGGNKWVEHTYKDGKENGLFTEWYENGQMSYEGIYKDGELDGLHIEWYDNGQKLAIRTYKDGKLDGLITKWYENGQKESEVNYKDEEIISEKWWNEDGSVKE